MALVPRLADMGPGSTSLVHGVFLLLAALVAPTGDVPIVVELRAVAEPGDGAVGLEGVVLFEPGRARSSEGFVLRSNRGRGIAVPTELDATGRYPDGSLRAARVLAIVPVALVRGGTVFHLVRGRSPAPKEPVRVVVGASGVVLEGGGTTLEFATTGPDLLRRLDVRGVPRRATERPARVVTSTDLGEASSERDLTPSVVVERSGPLRARVKLSGFALDAGDRAVLAWTLRVEARAGREPLRFTFDVEGLEDVGIAEDIALELPVRANGIVRARVLGAELAGPLERGVARVLSDDGRHVDAFLGTTRAGLDAARRCGLAAEDARGDGVGLVVSRLRPYAPRAVELTADGVLRLLAHAGPLLLDAETRIHVRGAIGPLSARAPATRFALEREPADALFAVDAAAIALPTDAPFGTDAVDPTTPGALRALSRLESALEACVGARDYGDYRLGDGFANLEYDPARAFYAAWLGTREATYANSARAMVEHWVRFDRSAGEGEVAPGLPFQHGVDHRSLTFEPGHVWAGGVVLTALLCGDPAAQGAAHELSHALVDLVATSERFDEERSYAWLLLALCDLDLLGPDPELRAARERLSRQLLQRQNAAGYFEIDRAQPGSTVFAVTPWVTGGITMQALSRARRLDGDEVGVREAIVRAADFLAIRARRKDGAFADKVAFGVELGAEFQPQGRAEPVDELMICAGLLRALELEDNGTWSMVVEERSVRALIALERSIGSPNEAARALAALRVFRTATASNAPMRR
ncbi:MAG: hypothetical protein IPH13_08305 [Planctomycetes bacterium]|nr:hypothetical protein [Planctomycetota bacterium]MCC7169718.1 hypothetical protein [Planctomycetota bacterium]